MTADWLGAFMIGLLGSGHCMAMCGGIASLLSIGQDRPSKVVPVFYNIGRIVSYALIGGIVGGAVASIASIGDFNSALVWLRIFTAIFMVMLACYIGKWWSGLLVVERLGQKLWRYVSPAGKSLLPLKHPLHAIPFGFIWGWLPCGLVYSALTWSAVSGSVANGAMIMLSFGLGTLPSMIMVGFGVGYLHNLQQSSTFRHIAALTILIYALYTLYGSVMVLSLNE